MKAIPRLCCLTAALLAAAPVFAQSGTALAFGGTGLVSSSQNLAGLAGGAVPYDPATPVSPAAGYTGPVFYGAAFPAGAAINQWNVFNDDANGDSLRYRVAAPAAGTGAAALFLWRRAQFAPPYDGATAVSLATPDAALGCAGRQFGAGILSTVRFVVADAAGALFVSAPQGGGLPGAFGPVTLANPAAAAWFAYDPATDTIAATTASPDLSAIEAAGVRLGLTKTGADGGAITAALTAFQVTAGSTTPAVTGGTAVFGIAGRPLQFTVSATNTPTSFAFGPLPAGLTADAATGTISGTPAAPGRSEVTVQAANAQGAGPAATLVVAIAEPSQAAIPAAGLVANFEFNGDANDLAANRGGIVHGATLVADRFGRPGRAYHFDGHSQYIEVADADDFSVPTTGDLTISVWMQPDATTFPIEQGSGYVHWLGKGQADEHEWTFRMYGADNTEGRENRTSFYLFNPAGGLGAGSYVQQPVAAGEWIHYVAVVSSSQDTITWYKNGVAVDQDAFHDSVYAITPVNGSAPLRIGTRDFGSYFQGAIDDLRIYGRALGAAEVRQLSDEGADAAVVVRHAPTLDGALDGTVQVLRAENVTLNGGAWISGDLRVPGTPALVPQGNALVAGVIDSTGEASPADRRVTLNGASVLRYLVRRVTPVALPAVAAPATPAGTRRVTLNGPGDSAGDFATVRDLTLNAQAGAIAVPPGTYGRFIANAGTRLVLGAGDGTPAVYELAGLTLNGGAALEVLGPVTLIVGTGVTLDGATGAEGHADWLDLRVAAGGVTLNGHSRFHGRITAPDGAVTINGGAQLTGRVQADRLTLNHGGGFTAQ